MKILICEDNPVIALDLEIMLEEIGHEVCGAVGSSAECLALVAVARPDLVTVDLDLADGPPGLRLVRFLHERGIGSIIVSGQVSCLNEPHPASAVIPKPVDEARLASALSRVAAAEDGAATHRLTDPVLG